MGLGELPQMLEGVACITKNRTNPSRGGHDVDDIAAYIGWEEPFIAKSSSLVVRALERALRSFASELEVVCESFSARSHHLCVETHEGVVVARPADL